MLKTLQRWNIALTAFGAAVFAALFLYVTLAPADFDRRTRDFAISKVQEKVRERFAETEKPAAAGKVAEFAKGIAGRIKGKIDGLEGGLNAGMDRFIANILAKACKLDCERREAARLAVRAFYKAAIERHGMALERVEDLVKGKYDAVMTELRGDVKIFAGSTGLAMLFGLLLAIFRGAAARHLVPISLTLTVATGVAIYWYLFGQNWVTTILYSDYWGWSYAVMLGVLFAFMLDIAINRARITSAVLNGIVSIFSNPPIFLPC